MKSVAKYKCPLCEKFFTKYSLQAHLRFHTGERCDFLLVLEMFHIFETFYCCFLFPDRSFVKLATPALPGKTICSITRKAMNANDPLQGKSLKMGSHFCVQHAELVLIASKMFICFTVQNMS